MPRYKGGEMKERGLYIRILKSKEEKEREAAEIKKKKEERARKQAEIDAKQIKMKLEETT